MVSNPDILHFDPLAETGTNDGFVDLGPGLTPEEAARIKTMLANSQVPRLKDPLVQFLGPLEVWTLDAICHGKCVVFGVRGFLTPDDRSQLKPQAARRHQMRWLPELHQWQSSRSRSCFCDSQA